MYVLLTDETNVRPGKTSRFFIYGGLIVPTDSLLDLDVQIEGIREDAGYAPTDVLKFDTHARPDTVDIDTATAAKRAVVEACLATKCTFVAYAVLHAIAKERSQDDLILFGANTVLNTFNRFLVDRDSYGICLADELPVSSQRGYFSSLFQKGLEFDDGRVRNLDRIRLFGSTWIGASHIASAVDIVLGAFRYCVNTPKNEAAAAEMIASVAELLWGERVGDELLVLEKGFVLRPQIENIRVDEYRAEYEALIARLGELDDRGRARQAGTDAVQLGAAAERPDR